MGLLYLWQAVDPNGLADWLQPLAIEEAILILALFHWSFLGLVEVAFLSSFGKRLFGLKLQGARSAAFLRVFFFVPSLAMMGIGIFWGLFDRRKRCLHDHLVDAQPIEVARL